MMLLLLKRQLCKRTKNIFFFFPNQNRMKSLETIASASFLSAKRVSRRDQLSLDMKSSFSHFFVFLSHKWKCLQLWTDYQNCQANKIIYLRCCFWQQCAQPKWNSWQLRATVQTHSATCFSLRPNSIWMQSLRFYF